MPIEYDANGIVTQNLLEILEERENALKLVMGDDFIIDKTTPIGNMELADANNEVNIQSLIAWLIPNQLDANTATGIFLDAICEKNRIYRKQPQYTTLNFVLNGTPNTQFYSGDIIVMDSLTGIYYDLNDDAVIGSDGKISVKFICESYGEYYPSVNSVLEIQTPVVGLDSVVIDTDNTNLVVGRLAETDDELRRRRQYSVGQTATTTMASMLASIYSLNGVLHATYFENDTETTDSHGVPMKSFEFIVDGGDEDEIADVIFLNKSIGSRAYGTTIKEKEDSEGNLYFIGYTKAEEVNVGMKINLSVSSLQSEAWKTKIKTALKDKFDDIQGIGNAVKNYDYFTVLTTFSGINNIDSVKLYDVSVGDTTLYDQLPIGEKAIGKLDVSNIEITAEVG